MPRKQTSISEYCTTDQCTRRYIHIQMSPRPVTPSDPNDSVRETDAEGHELLPSGPHKQQKNLSPKEDSPRPSQLSTTWRDYWKTPAAMAALFLLGPYNLTTNMFRVFLMFKTISLDNRYNSPRPIPVAGQKTDEWSRFYSAELCSGTFASPRTSL